MNARFAILSLFLVAALGACSGSGANPTRAAASEAGGSGVTSSPERLDPTESAETGLSSSGTETEAATRKPWYTSRLSEAGFFVLPEPTDLVPFEVEALQGDKLSSSSLTGRITLLNFWATWCPPCRQEMPTIEKLQTEMRGENFGIVAISVQEDRKTVADFIKKNNYGFPIYLDQSGKVSASYATRGIPTTYLVGKDGKAIAMVIGAIEYDTPGMIAILRDLARRE